jgi:hypothetical protein
MSRDAHKRRRFLEKYLSGEVSAEDIDDYVDAWHAAPREEPIYEFLGLSREEYSLWLREPDALPYIAVARRAKKPLPKVIASRLREMSSDGRSCDLTKMQRLQQWLAQHGKTD